MWSIRFWKESFPTISAVDLMMNSGGKTYVYGMVLPHSLPATAVGRMNGLDEVRIRIYSHRLMHFPGAGF